MHEDMPQPGTGPTWQPPTPDGTEAAAGTGTYTYAYAFPAAPVRRRGNGAIRAGIIAGVASLVVLGVAVTMAAAPRSSTAAAGGGQALLADATPAASGAPAASAAPGRNGRGPGMMGGPGMPDHLGAMGGMGGFGGPGGMGGRGLGGFGGARSGGITITSVSGSSVGLKTDDGWTRTITVTDKATITKGGKTVGAADLAVGDTIRLSETRNSDGTYTIDAISVILPTVSGQVTGTSSTSVTIKDGSGNTVTVNVGSGATVTVNGATGKFSDLKTGMLLVAEGTKNSDGSLDATRIVAETSNGNRGWPGRGPRNNGASPAPSASPGTNG